MSWSVSRAARETGLSKSTISRAIKSGRISAARQHDGSYLIEPAELFRVYPRNVAQLPSDARHDAVRNQLQEASATTSKEIELLKLKLVMTEELLAQERENSKRQHETVQDLRKRLDAATDKVLALAQPTQTNADATLDAERNPRKRRLWWNWRQE